VDRGGIYRAWMEAALPGHGWRHRLGVRFLHLPLIRVGEVAGYVEGQPEEGDVGSKGGPM